MHLPSEVLSLEMKQINDLHYIVIVELEPDFQIKRVADYIDDLCGAGGLISKYLADPPSQHAKV